MSELLPHIKHNVEQGSVYPGYPTQRLVLPDFDPTQNAIEIPDGPWQINDSTPPTPAQTAAFQEKGYITDTKGRPLHSLAREMLTDPAIGVVTGKGRYWNWGPNYAADGIVITDEETPHILLIKRGDTGDWALPGGFIDQGETNAETAAVREVEEETLLHLSTPGQLIYKGIVGDRRVTLHAWAETEAYLFRIPQQQPVQGSDDATDAHWVQLASVTDTLFGSHRMLIDKALEKYYT